VERVVDLLRYRAEQAGVILRTEIEPDLPQTLIDENAMTLALLNLLENAMKYGLSEQGDILVSLARNEQNLVLRVADHGSGIPMEEKGRIFDRFFRGKEARSKSTRGSGIGLSLVKHIAEAHHGKVTVDSTLGKGTCFEVTLPIQEAG